MPWFQNHKSYRAEISRECSPRTMWHMSCVMCNMSCVTCQCHMSCVRTKNIIIIIIYILIITKWWRLLFEGLLSMGPTPPSLFIGGWSQMSTLSSGKLFTTHRTSPSNLVLEKIWMITTAFQVIWVCVAICTGLVIQRNIGEHLEFIKKKGV